MNRNNPQFNWWDNEFTEAGKPEFRLFDMTSKSIESIVIKKFASGNCFVIDKENNFFNGFILSRNSLGQTECKIDFFRSSKSGKHVPRPLFQVVKNDGTIANSNASNTSTRRISFQDEDQGRDNFWKLIQFLLKFKDIVDLGEFDAEFQIHSPDEITDFLNNKENYLKLTDIAKQLNSDVSGLLRPSLTLGLLREYSMKLEEFIKNKSSETEIQKWIDEDNGNFRQQRCMIFGIEFIDFYREGSSSSKKFDILTRVGSEYSKYIDHVLIELKGINANIFDLKQTETINEPTFEYAISPKLSRAIPQILEYRYDLQAKPIGDSELEKVGIIDKNANIKKCIIIIGETLEDGRWQKNRKELMKSLSSNLEIWTYTELLNKLNTTIKVLDKNYKEGKE